MDDRKLNRIIKSIQKQTRTLQAEGYTIEGEETETMLGNLALHVYLRDRVGNRVVLQKHLFTLNK